jgi:hypothetical protein
LILYFNEVRNDDNIYVTVPRGKSYGDIIEEFKSLIEKELPSKMKGRKLPPAHRYAPTEIQGVKRDSLRMMFDLQKNIFSQAELKGVALRERVLKFFASERYKKKRNIVPMSFAIDASNRNNDHAAEAKLDDAARERSHDGQPVIVNPARGKGLSRNHELPTHHGRCPRDKVAPNKHLKGRWPLLARKLPTPCTERRKEGMTERVPRTIHHPCIRMHKQNVVR